MTCTIKNGTETRFHISTGERLPFEGRTIANPLMKI